MSFLSSRSDSRVNLTTRERCWQSATGGWQSATGGWQSATGVVSRFNEGNNRSRWQIASAGPEIDEGLSLCRTVHPVGWQTTTQYALLHLAKNRGERTSLDLVALQPRSRCSRWVEAPHFALAAPVACAPVASRKDGVGEMMGCTTLGRTLAQEHGAKTPSYKQHSYPHSYFPRSLPVPSLTHARSSLGGSRVYFPSSQFIPRRFPSGR